MSLIKRFLTSFVGEDRGSDEPAGLVEDQSGGVYVIKDDGTRERLGNGGSLPSQWTVDPHGQLRIEPDAVVVGVNALDVRASADWGNQDVVAVHPDSTRPNTYVVLGTDANGEIVVKSTGAGSLARILLVDDENGQITVDTANGLDIEPGGGGNFFYGILVSPNAAPQVATVCIKSSGSSQTTPLLQVLDSAFAECFRVDADGTVHIKTGGTIVADL